MRTVLPDLAAGSPPVAGSYEGLTDVLVANKLIRNEGVQSYKERLKSFASFNKAGEAWMQAVLADFVEHLSSDERQKDTAIRMAVEEFEIEKTNLGLASTPLILNMF